MKAGYNGTWVEIRVSLEPSETQIVLKSDNDVVDPQLIGVERENFDENNNIVITPEIIRNVTESLSDTKVT